MTTKSFTFFCTVVLIAIALCAGGVFAVFAYARSDVEPKSEYLNKYIDLEYPTFTQAMTDMMNFADGTEILGLNSVAYYAQFTEPDAPEINDGVMHAYAKTSFSRRSYNYVGSMDSSYGRFFHAADSIAVVMRYAVTVGTGDDSVVYLYMASAKTLNKTNVDKTILVFRVGYKYAAVTNPDGTTASAGYYLIKDAEGNPVVEKGASPVKLYEGQSDGAKTFGVHGGNEIFVADGK
ncbi:MAG: hypothetical protein SO386_01330 [Eubacteriales bacterium]|nr:hypothetical protein [Eubacteriales bacterium]